MVMSFKLSLSVDGCISMRSSCSEDEFVCSSGFYIAKPRKKKTPIKITNNKYYIPRLMQKTAQCASKDHPVTEVIGFNRIPLPFT